MPEDEELFTNLVDLYDVSFILQTLEKLLADKMFEDDDYDSKLLSAFPNNNIISYGLIGLFFSQSILIKILTNTNEYAKAGIVGHVWLSLILDELKIWLGIVIYMGVIKLPRVTDYWLVNPKYPRHDIIQTISI
ncbi:10092_t:CDS:2 [Dentiscutata heterogama]|uniref:10092_t:CDS:1 n=1 Tax=Dentiscutata heterogama TaxID=1316150 RepID=A0ACA9ND49_9GLOM|nr:10092_t:CDS:2 [Dentiscutata heterogama]